MDRDVLFKTVLPMTGTIVLLMAFIVSYYRFGQGSTDRAHQAFEGAMRAMVDRLQISYHAASGPNDFPGAVGSYREHHIALFVISVHESSMQTGVLVNFQRPLGEELMARLRWRQRTVKGGKLDVRGQRRKNDAALPPPIETAIGALLASVVGAEVERDKLVLTLEGGRSSFFGYHMLTDPDRLLAATDAALDMSIVLEQASAI